MNSLFPHWFKNLSFVCQDLVLILFFSRLSAERHFKEEGFNVLRRNGSNHSSRSSGPSPGIKPVTFCESDSMSYQTVQIFSKCQIVIESRENYQADLNKFLKKLADILRSNIDLLTFRLFNRFIIETVTITSLSQSLKTVYLLL